MTERCSTSSSARGVRTSLSLRLTLALLACVLAMALSLPTGADAVTCSSIKATRVVSVKTASELKSALSGAKAGDRIDLAAGTYTGSFALKGKSGTSSKPIVVCGPRSAVLSVGSTSKSYGLHLESANYVQLLGFTVTSAQKGIMLDASSNCKLSELLVHNVGHEAVHFRKNSQRNRLENSEIRTTGRIKADFGEGVYIGSAKSNQVGDKSDFNQIVGNRIGPDVTAEAIDVKEYTSSGVITDNVFDGKGMSGANYADSWIDVKGNGYLIQRNQGTNSLKDGMQTHSEVAGWGSYNVFDSNVLNVNGPGVGIETAKDTINIVRCNNKVSGAKLGLTNLKECSDKEQTLGKAPTATKANWPKFSMAVQEEQEQEAAPTPAPAQTEEGAADANADGSPASTDSAPEPAAAPAPTSAPSPLFRRVATRMPTLMR